MHSISGPLSRKRRALKRNMPKTALIEKEGGRCHFVERAGDVYDEALRLEAELGGHFIDQFTMAERATDWRGNNNIAESIFAQLVDEEHPVPIWISPDRG